MTEDPPLERIQDNGRFSARTDGGSSPRARGYLGKNCCACRIRAYIGHMEIEIPLWLAIVLACVALYFVRCAIRAPWDGE
jgi:hypothetical protein